jgi:hypothetical protein
MIQYSHLEPPSIVTPAQTLVPHSTIEQDADLEELDDADLDFAGGGCGMHRRSRHGRFGKQRGAHSSFHKHSRSISGQTITKPDGTSITSFSIQEESISSEASDFSDM